MEPTQERTGRWTSPRCQFLKGINTYYSLTTLILKILKMSYGRPKLTLVRGFLGGKNLPANAGEMQFQSLDQEDPLEKERATTPVFLPGKSH